MKLKSKLRLKTKHWFALMVVLPTIIAAIYFGLFASDQYFSQSRFIVKSVSQKNSQISTLANLVQTTGLSGGQEQTNEILDYIRSRNGLADLEKRTGFRARYNISQADFLSRYPQPFHEDRFETLYRYYGNAVEAHLDNETGTAVLTVRAFSARDAQQINATLLMLSEDLVNRLNVRAETRAVAEARRQVADATQRVLSARQSLASYRNAHDLVDPAKQATGVFDIATRLSSEQAAVMAQLELMERAAPSHPSIPALRRRVAALANQINAQTGRAVGTRDGIASKMGPYENLLLEQELSAQNLALANVALEQARNEAVKQKFYLERIVEPDAPDVALYPARLRSTLLVFGVALCLFLVMWMLTVGVLEHAPEES